MDIADRRSNIGTHGHGRERWLQPRDRRKVTDADLEV